VVREAVYLRDPTLSLKDMLDAIEATERFTQGIDYETFRQDDTRSSAVIRKFDGIIVELQGAPRQ
jgi:uncharacterized protein with HEPN domain